MSDQTHLSDLTPEEAILHEVSVKLLSSADCREVLDLIAYHAVRLLGAGKASINLAEDGRLRTVAKYIEPDGYFEFLRSKQMGAHPLPPDTHPHMYETLRTGRPRIVRSQTIHDLKARVLGGAPQQRPEIFYILEPLRLEEEVLGVAAVNLGRPELEAITARQRRTLEQLLSFAAVALRNARLIEELRVSEERFRALEAVAQVGILFTDARGHLTYANQYYCRIAGRQANELQGWGWAAAIHPEDRERISTEWERAAASGQHYSIHEYRFLHADGGVVWAWANTAPLHSAAGELLGHVAVVADITERKLSEEALRLSEERYALAQRAAHIGSWDWNILTGELKWSETVEPLFGLAPGQFGRTYEAFLRCVHEEDRPLVTGAVKACVEQGTGYDIEHRIVWPDGTVRWVSETGNVVRDAEGRALRMLGVVQDVTERIRRQQELEEANRRLEDALHYQRAVLDSLEEAVLSLDLEGRIVYVNPAASRLFGHSTEEFRGLRICDLRLEGGGCGAGGAPCLIERLEKTAASLCEREVEYRTKEGRYIYGRQTLTPLRDAAGRVIGAVVVVQDISGERRLESQAAYFAEKVDELLGHSPLVFVSQGMGEVVRQVELVARTDSTVLITGETGTGKELVARLIHEMSPRKDRPLVKVHCAALSPGLIESEFFGHEKGAFTGALARKIGRFELADGGTIFLDEVGDIPLETQVKLLRVIQEREFERVGGTRPIKVDVRIVAATNRDMEAAVEEGRFRRDLYYRLNVFPIRVPPLRERPEAIPVMAAHFARDCAKALGKTIEGIEAESLRRLKSYAWPGNVRELRNVIERAAITATGPVVRIGRLGAEPTAPATPAESLELAAHERRHVLSVLELVSWRIEGKGGAAEILNLNPSTLRSRLKKLGIVKPPRGHRANRRQAANIRGSN